MLFAVLLALIKSRLLWVTTDSSPSRRTEIRVSLHLLESAPDHFRGRAFQLI